MVDFSTLKEPVITKVAELRGLKHPEMGPEELVVFPAASCFSRKTAVELYERAKAKKSSIEFEEYKATLLDKTITKGHLAVLDQAFFSIDFNDIPRMFTLQLCSDQYRMHMQQSLRRVNIQKDDLYLPSTLIETPLAAEIIDLFNAVFELYSQMTDAGIPREIARGPFPLFLTTAIHTTGNGRAWWEFFNSSIRKEMPSTIRDLAVDVKGTLRDSAPKLFEDREQVMEALNYMPSASLFYSTNLSLKKEIQIYGSLEKVILRSFELNGLSEQSVKLAIEDRNLAELANLKHIHFTMLWPMSLYTWHQSERQRTLDHTIESIYDAAERGKVILPQRIANSPFENEYLTLSSMAIELYKSAIRQEYLPQEVIGIIPHNLMIFDKVHVNGFNAAYMIGKRRCKEAQGEIANLAKQSAELIAEVFPPLGKYAQPQGVLFSKCPEGKWDKCGYCKAIVNGR